MKLYPVFLVAAGLTGFLGAVLVSCVGAEPAIPGVPDASADSSVNTPGSSSPTMGTDAGGQDAGFDAPASSCVANAPCSPANCATGLTACGDAGVQTCVAQGTIPNGEACDAGVCFNGTCSPCSVGADCAEAGSCVQATISCGTGNSVCATNGNAPNGTACGANLYCEDGKCAACTAGTNCGPPANPCHVGTVSCVDGGIVCTDTSANAPDGTACGLNEVCSGGQCVSCTAGTSCHPGSMPCQTGTTSCATGTTVCTNGVNVPDGTRCGTNEVCTSGACVACASGSSCSPNGNSCLTGVTSCTTGTQTCTSTGSVANGTACSSGVCNNGQCTGCTSGGTCSPGSPPNPCQTGAYSCSTGTQTCVSTGNVANGSSCGTSEVCNSGACVSCVAGASCSTGNVCQRGAESCSTGAQACVSTGNLTNGTSCGTGEVCDNGVCTGCASGASCSTGNPCTVGTTSCASGTSSCTTTGNAANGAPCGASGICCAGACATCSTATSAMLSCTAGNTCQVTCDSGLTNCNGSCVNTANDANACGASCRMCPSGSQCLSSSCAAVYGDGTAFSPCGGGTNAVIPPSILIGQLVTIPAATTVTALGMIGNPGGGSAIMALYSNSAALPSTLETQSASTPVGSGMNVYPVPSIGLGAGSYWVMVEVSANSTICNDGGTSTTLVYGSESYGTLPESFSSVSGGPTTIRSTVAYNLFLVDSD